MRRNFQALTDTAFDLLVIGGGIHGAALAWAASLAGLSVALIERGDFANATSANSQKIIHGGLRYLQEFDFARSLESIRDRARWMWLAPHLAHPLPCLIPLTGFGMRGPEVMRAGLALYRALARREVLLPDPAKQFPAPRVVSRAEALRKIPCLPPQGLRGGACWHDGYVHHTERLVLALVRTAQRQGAVAANYLSADRLILRDGRADCVSARDVLGHEKFDIRARHVADCTGPWEGALWKTGGVRKHLVAGINLVTRPLYPEFVAAGFRAAGGDSRFYFVSPWRGCSIVGTEWFRHEEPADAFRVTESMVDQFLSGFNRACPASPLSRADILYTHRGLVPADETAWARGDPIPMAAHSQVRDDTQSGVPGLIAVTGVKYTTALSTAEQAIRCIRPGYRLPPIPDLPRLVGGEIPDWNAFLAERTESGWPDDTIRDYGTEIDALGSSPGRLLENQVEHAVRHELALRLSDVVLRRTSLASCGRTDDQTLSSAARLMGTHLGWSDATRESELTHTTDLLSSSL